VAGREKAGMKNGREMAPGAPLPLRNGRKIRMKTGDTNRLGEELRVTQRHGEGLHDNYKTGKRGNGLLAHDFGKSFLYPLTCTKRALADNAIVNQH
jgi:hypothetical protein